MKSKLFLLFGQIYFSSLGKPRKEKLPRKQEDDISPKMQVFSGASSKKITLDES